MATTSTASCFSRLRSRCVFAGVALALGPLLCMAAPKAAAPAAPPAALKTPVSLNPAASATAPDTVGRLSAVPVPELSAKAWVTLDANSGQVIAALNPDEPIEPASLTKIMSAYVVFEAIENKRLSLSQTVNISEAAWRTEGSRTFVKLNTQVSIDDLLQGLIVQSGNDATVALAEAVAGSESAFATLMNQEAVKMGLKGTHYVNSTGLPDPAHLTTVRDMAVLAENLVNRFPQYLHYYSEKEFTYNKIKQHNRNRLLWIDTTVDGLKTGHTKTAGYCLVATALRDGRRVVSVVVGAPSDSARTESSLKLLNWSFTNFDTIKLYDNAKPAVQARVWEGTVDKVGLGGSKPTWVTVPRGKGEQVKAVAQYTQPLIAPLKKGSKVGSVSLSLDGTMLRRDDLAVLDDVPEAGFFGRVYDKIRLMFH